MAQVWGEAEVVLHTDGRALPGEVQAATTVAAIDGGQAFQKAFNRQMRLAARGAIAEFIKNFTDPMVRVIRNSRAFQELSRRLRMVRTDFRILGNYVRGEFGDAMTNLRTGVQNTIRPFREFAQEVGERSRLATDELREGMTHLRISAQDLRDTFPGLARAYDRVRDASTRVGDTFRTLGNRFSIIRNTIRDTRQGVLDFRVALENLRVDGEQVAGTFNKQTEVQRTFGDTIRKNAEHSRTFFGSWKRLPHGFRQFTVWTTAILSAFEQLAVLGSAAGGSILVGLGALTQFGIGVGATIAVFQDLNNELDTLPEHLRPAAAAFQDIGTAFGEMQDAIQATGLRDAEGAFRTMGDTVRALIPAFQPLAEVINNSIGRLAEALKPGTEAFTDLETLIRNSAPTFQTMLDAAGNLGSGLLAAFADPKMQRAIEKLVGWVEDLTQDFEDFAKSDEFGKWIDRTVEVMGEFTELLEGVGTMLNNLVTDDAVERTTSMLDALTDSLPMFEALLSTLGELDVFGLIAEAFAALTPLLTPFLQVLEPIAAIIRDVLIVGFNNLAIAAGVLSAVLLPARLLWEAFAAVFDAFVQWITPVQEALIDVGTALQNASDKIIEELVPAFEDIADAIFEMLPSPQEFERFLREELIPAIEDMAQWIVDHVVPAVQDFARWLRDEGIPAAQDFWRFLTEKLIPMFEDLITGIGDAVREFSNFGRDIRGVIRTLTAPIQGLIDLFRNLFGAASSASGAAAGVGGGGRGRLTAASGRILTGPTNVYAGEAGPEAIVPLRRSLSQVDPSVRWLSAIAQGKGSPFASGGIVGASGGGPSVMITDGGIVITEAGDANRTAQEVVNRIFERVGG